MYNIYHCIVSRFKTSPSQNCRYVSFRAGEGVVIQILKWCKINELINNVESKAQKEFDIQRSLEFKLHEVVYCSIYFANVCGKDVIERYISNSKAYRCSHF